MVDVVAAESRCAPASGTGRPPRCCPWPSRSRRAPSGRACRGCCASLPPANSSASSQRRFAEHVEHAVAGPSSKSARLGASARRISGMRQALRVVRVVEAVAALDAQPLVVGRAVAAVDVEDLVVLDVVGELAADAAVRADATATCLSGTASATSRAGISAPVGQACTHSPQATQVESPIGSSMSNTIFACVAAEGQADDVVDLLVAAGAHAARALDAGVEVDGDRRVREVGRDRRARREARLADAELRGPLVELVVARVLASPACRTAAARAPASATAARARCRSSPSCPAVGVRQHDGASTRSPLISTMHARQLPTASRPSL